MGTQINWLIPDSGPFRCIYEWFRNDRGFANRVRNGGTTVVLTMKDPIIRVKVAKDGKTLFSDEEALYTEWLYGCTGKEFLRIFGPKTKSKSKSKSKYKKIKR